VLICGADDPNTKKESSGTALALIAFGAIILAVIIAGSASKSCHFEGKDDMKRGNKTNDIEMSITNPAGSNNKQKLNKAFS
jgi:hypothetical protein